MCVYISLLTRKQKHRTVDVGRGENVCMEMNELRK